MAATTSRMPEQYQPLQEEEVDDVPFTPLKALQNVGVQQADIKKLSEAGFATVEQILMTSKRKLTDVKGLSEAKVAKIGDAANKVCPNKLAFKSGLERQKTRQETVFRITTGSKELDDILGGGVESGSLTEFYGEYRTGKSQLAATLAVTSQLPLEMGGGDGKARARRCTDALPPPPPALCPRRRALAPAAPSAGDVPRHRGLVPRRALRRDRGALRPRRRRRQLEHRTRAAADCRRLGLDPRAGGWSARGGVVLGDHRRLDHEPPPLRVHRPRCAPRTASTAAPPRHAAPPPHAASRRLPPPRAASRRLPLPPASGELSERQQRLGQVLKPLKQLAETFNVAVYMTNQVCADPGGSVFVQDAKKAVGGHVLAHLVDTRVSIRKGKGEQRVAKVLQHAFKGEAEATLQITPGGIDDAKD